MYKQQDHTTIEAFRLLVIAALDWAGLLPTWTSATPPDEAYLVVRVTTQRIDPSASHRGESFGQAQDRFCRTIRASAVR